MLDGGILFPKSLFLNIPLPSIKVSKRIKRLVDSMIAKETKYLTYKMNARKKQESIKFPVRFREQLNNEMFPGTNFSIIHQNKELSNE